MKKAIEFLRTHWDVALATVGPNNRPKLRAFQIMRIDDDNTIYFATSKDKEVYKQLMSNPYMEILAMDGNVSVRVAGVAEFNVPDKTAESIYFENTILQGLYEDYRSVVFFIMNIQEVDYYDMTTNPPVLETYSV